jgi:hypothetical protein
VRIPFAGHRTSTQFGFTPWLLTTRP